MAAQVRDSAPSPRRLIDGQGKIRVRGASSQILFASLLLHLFGLVQAFAHGIVERARECGSSRHFPARLDPRARRRRDPKIRLKPDTEGIFVESDAISTAYAADYPGARRT